MARKRGTKPDAIAHMFAVSSIPADNQELPPDPKALANILIDAKP